MVRFRKRNDGDYENDNDSDDDDDPSDDDNRRSMATVRDPIVPDPVRAWGPGAGPSVWLKLGTGPSRSATIKCRTHMPK